MIIHIINPIASFEINFVFSFEKYGDAYINKNSELYQPLVHPIIGEVCVHVNFGVGRDHIFNFFFCCETQNQDIIFIIEQCGPEVLGSKTNFKKWAPIILKIEQTFC